jgi:hypothetical protein
MAFIYTITTQRELRQQFWICHPELSRKKVTYFEGAGKMYTTETRGTFVEFVDSLRKSDVISESLAQRATLD